MRVQRSIVDLFMSRSLLAIRSDPLIGRCGLINLPKLVFVRAGVFGNLDGSIGDNISSDDADIFQQLCSFVADGKMGGEAQV